jgi:hypothetical protein
MQRTHKNLHRIDGRIDARVDDWMERTPAADEAHSWLSRRLVWERRLSQLERAC